MLSYRVPGSDPSEDCWEDVEEPNTEIASVHDKQADEVWYVLAYGGSAYLLVPHEMTTKELRKEAMDRG